MIEAKDYKINLGNDISSLKSEAISSLKNDEVVYNIIKNDLSLSVKEVEDNLAALMCLKEDKDYCKNCPGLDACKKDYPKYNIVLRRDGNDIVREYTMCPLSLASLEKKSRFMIANFPAEWLDVELADVKMDTPKRKKLIKDLSISIRQKNDKWFYVTGNGKCGKSFIMAAYGSSFAKHRGRGVVFTSFTDLSRDLSSLFLKDKEKFNKNMSKLMNCPLLIIDDFGNEFLNDLSFSNIVFPLIHFRSTKNLPTCFVSEFELEEISSLYDKINSVRVKQFVNMIKKHIDCSYDVSGVNPYKK